MIENDENPQSWPPIPQGKSQSKAIDRAQRKTQPLNFQDYFLQICTFKRYETLLHATPTFKNRSKTYGAPCINKSGFKSRAAYDGARTVYVICEGSLIVSQVFGIQLKTVYLRGPHSLRPHISRPCCTSSPKAE